MSLKDYAQLLVDECSRLEPGHAEVCGDEVSETKIVFENTDFSVASSSQSTVLGLRVILNNRLGFITTNSLDKEDLKVRAKEAQMVARLSPENAFHDMAKVSAKESFSLFEDKLSRATAKQLLEWTELLVDEARLDKRVTLDRAELTLTTSERVVQNSNGVFQQVRQASCSWFVMGMAKTASEVTSFDYEAGSTATFSEVERKIRETAKLFREGVVGSLGATGAKSYKGLVLFHPAAVSSLLMGVIGFNVNARGQQDGMSKWKDALGSLVASEALSVSENPLDINRPGEWTPFDREGVLTSAHAIIKNGVLNFTAHNAFTAKRAGVTPTGNATGGARSIPSIGLHALTVGTGTKSTEALYSDLKEGLVLKRFSGNADPVSGQFSGIAKNSWWVEQGKRHSSLKEVMISGNMFELLKNIKGVGSESFCQMDSFNSPYILIDGVSVTSA